MEESKMSGWTIMTTKIGDSYIIDCSFRCYIGAAIISRKGKEVGIKALKKELKKLVMQRLEDK